MTSSDIWGEDLARTYDSTDGRFAPEELDPTVDFLADLAGGGAALEFAIGTGRVGIPLAARGVPVTGIELSEAMLRQLRTKVDAAALPVVQGDMATTRVDGEFALVYLVYNTITNLRRQAEQVACFQNAARHLVSGGRFVVEVGLPPLRSMPPGQSAVVFAHNERHFGYDTIDVVEQGMTSHHYWHGDDGSIRYSAGNFRYVWPSECDLMAQLAGMELERRVADWHGNPFTAESRQHISVWRKP